MVEYLKFYKIYETFIYSATRLWWSTCECSKEISLKGVKFMTSVQNKYRELVENQRHNIAGEKLTAIDLAERERTNRANEQLKQQANEINRYGIDTSAATSRYSTDVNAQTQRYTAHLNANTSKRNTDVQASASRANAQTAAAASRYASDQSSSASRYSSDQSARASKYATDVRARTERVNQSISALNARVNAYNARTQRAKTEAEINNLASQAKRNLAEAENVVKQYTLNAREQDNRDALRKANIAQGWINTATQGIDRLGNTGKNITQAQKNIMSIGMDILKALSMLK